MNGARHPSGSRDGLIVKDSPIDHKGVFAEKAFANGQKIAYFEGYHIDEETRYSVTFAGEHIEPTGILKYLNHSCSPNAIFQDRWLIALRAIEPKEEITIDYTMTESRISNHFQCLCGAKSCRSSV